jgi:hypothetical protein
MLPQRQQDFDRADQDVSTLQDTLWLAVLEKGANVDRRNHSTLVLPALRC